VPRAARSSRRKIPVVTPATRIHLERTSAYRFTTRNRLLDARAFARVFDKAARSRDALFTVLYRDNDIEIARLGLAISKKNCRKATDRNRIKRIIRESFRHHGARLAGLDVVVLNQPAATEAPNPALFESLERHWQRCRPNAAGINRSSGNR
jgi:ribonuclease P protein component